jgi:predicted dehydrogenase
MGLVGAGNFGRLHAFTLAGLAEAELVAIVDRDEAVLNAIRQELPEIRAWTSIEDALREVDAEAWVIATPTESHVPLAKQVLSTGADVLIEKPLAESLLVGRELELLVTPESGRIMLGHILLFATEVRQLLLEVSQRSPLVHFHAARHRPTRLAELYGESPLRLLMVHDLYLAFALMARGAPSQPRFSRRPACRRMALTAWSCSAGVGPPSCD